MHKTIALAAAVSAMLFLSLAAASAAELKAADVANAKGDGPDGKGNTADDTWQFWFQLAHAPEYRRLDIGTADMPPEQRQKGIPRKVDGPIANGLPNPKNTDGWIYHSDWNGQFEGIWGDKKAKQVLLHPYVEKNFHGPLAITYKVPKTGPYTISGKVTDLQVIKFRKHTGIVWSVEIVKARDGKSLGKAEKVVGKGGPVGDKVGPDSQEFSFEKVALQKGQLVRLVIDPNKWWGTDLTRIDRFRIAPAGEAKPTTKPAESKPAKKAAARPLGPAGIAAVLGFAAMGAFAALRSRRN